MKSSIARRRWSRLMSALLALSASIVSAHALAQSVQYASGKGIFDTKCAVCHQAGGKGQDGLAPPLTQLPGRYAGDAAGRRQLGLTVLNGMFGAITIKDKTYNFKMPSFASASDEELASVLNYVVFDLNAKHDKAKPFTAAEIKTLRAAPMDGAQVRENRAALIKSLGL